jgi:hypothetical protein
MMVMTIDCDDGDNIEDDDGGYGESVAVNICSCQRVNAQGSEKV